MAVIKCFETHVRNTNNIFNKILRIIILFYIFSTATLVILIKNILLLRSIYI